MPTQITKPKKLALVGFRMLPEQRQALETIAREKGTTISNLIRPFAERIISESLKTENPAA